MSLRRSAVHKNRYSVLPFFGVIPICYFFILNSCPEDNSYYKSYWFETRGGVQCTRTITLHFKVLVLCFFFILYLEPKSYIQDNLRLHLVRLHFVIWVLLVFVDLSRLIFLHIILLLKELWDWDLIEILNVSIKEPILFSSRFRVIFPCYLFFRTWSCFCDKKPIQGASPVSDGSCLALCAILFSIHTGE